MAVGVEGGDGVEAEIDGKVLYGEAAGGAVLEVLEDAEAVEALVAGMDKAVARLEVTPQRLPKLVGGELLPQEGRERGLDIGIVEGWEEVGGGLDGIETLRSVEGVALIHGIEAAGYGRACAKRHTGGGASLRSHIESVVGRIEALEDLSGLGKLLHEVEVLATHERGDAANATVSPGRTDDSGAEGGESVWAADAEKPEVVVAHIALVTQHGAVEVVAAAERMIVGHAEGLMTGMIVEGMEEGFEIERVAVGVGIKADEDLVVVALLKDAVEELFTGIAYTTAFAAPAQPRRAAIDDH